MGKSIKTGGFRKNPAIEKMNQLNAISSRAQVATELEKKAFQKEESNAKKAQEKRKQIVNDYEISFGGK